MENEWDAEFERIDNESVSALDDSMSVEISSSLATGTDGDTQTIANNTSSGMSCNL